MGSTFPHTVRVTDQDINLSTLSVRQQDHYRALAAHVLDLYRKHAENRMVIGFAGQSGSGKSVTVEILRALLTDMDGGPAVYTADIDAFHYPNTYLEATADSEGTVLRSVKGRYDTYDVCALEIGLAQFTSGESLMLPHYSRVVHDPVADGQQVEAGPGLLLLAGLWLLRSKDPWESVRRHIAHTFLIQGNTDRMREYSIMRHMRGGKDRVAAERFYESSDARNAQEILSCSVEPDETVQFFEDIA